MEEIKMDNHKLIAGISKVMDSLEEYKDAEKMIILTAADALIKNTLQTKNYFSMMALSMQTLVNNLNKGNS